MTHEVREELLKRLRVVATRSEPFDGEVEHGDCESLLLMVLGDDEVSAAWKAARKNWWYA